MPIKVYNHNVFEPWPLADNSVQCIITSPPYWAVRKFDIPDIAIGGSADCLHRFELREHSSHKKARIRHTEGTCIKCGAWMGQYGLEPDWRMYVEHTLLWIEEAMRVLKDDGCFFLNVGDTYGGSWGGYSDKKGQTLGHRNLDPDLLPPSSKSRPKCQLPIPEMLALGLYNQGWYIRNRIIWYKKGMPDSIKDKFMGRYELIYFLTKNPQYEFDLDPVRVPYRTDSIRRNNAGYGPSRVPNHAHADGKTHQKSYQINELGANPGNVWTLSPGNDALEGPEDVWEISPGRSTLAHYAMFPTALAERMIKCGSKPGDLICDPFIGSGTTGEVAVNLGRECVGFDIGYEEVRRERLGLLCQSNTPLEQL